MTRVNLTGSDTATCGTMTVKARHGIIGKIARQLIENGENPDDLLEVYRDGTKAFKDAPISAWPALTTEESANGKVRFGPWMPFSGAR